MNPQKIKVAVAGATGKMGKLLIEAILLDPLLVLSGALTISSDKAIGCDAGNFLGHNTNVSISSDIHKVISKSDYLIDFTCPEATLSYIDIAKNYNVNLVIGTTGFSEEQKSKILDASNHIGIVLSPNMSIGVNIVMKLLDFAARQLGSNYDIEIIEAHHRNKVDAPSGTAIKMGEVIASALNLKLSDYAVYKREGIIGSRSKKSIGFATVRGGDIIGDHTVMFAGKGERIEISHKSSSRHSYVKGALYAVRFLASCPKVGLFDMKDVLGLY